MFVTFVPNSVYAAVADLISENTTESTLENDSETTIIALFILWVLFWNIVPLICRLKSPKHEENDIEN